jgi:thioesterase domain-containing protein/NAD(P)-dependent dehydrogenase (short-subunit alcohol dehydrogenase family)
MSAAKYIGKIIITMDGEKVLPKEPLRELPAKFLPNASYLMTGGLGGFGLALAKLMVQGGAKQLVLTGRSGAATPEAKRGVKELQTLGAKVFVVKMDVTREADVKKVFSFIRKNCAPLRGVLHTAAVLDDGTLMQLNAERFARVMAPKVAGTWHLHRATEKMALDCFVLFSSVASLVGAAGQGNYAAANSFMDALAQYRRARGLTALSVNWGAIADVGLAARDKKVAAHLAASGVTGITPAQAGAMLGRLTQTSAAQLGFMRVDWSVRAKLGGGKNIPARFEELIQASGGDAAGGGAELRNAILSAPAGERTALVVAHVRDIVARVLRTSAAKLEIERPLKEMGLDSLMAFELLNRVENVFGISLPPSKLSAGGSITKLADVVLELMAGGADAKVATTEATVAVEAKPTDADGALPESLIALRAEGSQPPLFVFHPAGGIITNFDDLVKVLPASLPIYGLQSRAYSDERGERATLAEMARDYAQLIHERQPAGDLRLTGFSAGGFYALATARELEKLGRKVAFIGLLDTAVQLLDPASSRTDFLRQHMAEMYRYLTLDLALAEPLPDGKAEAVITHLAQISSKTKPAERVQTTLDWLAQEGLFEAEKFDAAARQYLTVFNAHWDFISDLKLETIHAPVHYWNAVPPGEQPVLVPPQLRAATQARLTTSVIAGRHYEIMTPPIVSTLAKQLVAALAKAAR